MELSCSRPNLMERKAILPGSSYSSSTAVQKQRRARSCRSAHFGAHHLPQAWPFHRSQIAVLRVELRRARSENPGIVAEILVALDQELEALAQARMAAQGELHPGPWPKSS